MALRTSIALPSRPWGGQDSNLQIPCVPEASEAFTLFSAGFHPTSDSMCSQRLCQKYSVVGADRHQRRPECHRCAIEHQGLTRHRPGKHSAARRIISTSWAPENKSLTDSICRRSNRELHTRCFVAHAGIEPATFPKLSQRLRQT